MWSTDDILRTENFNDLSKSQLLDIISVLRNDLKYHKYRRDVAQEQSQTLITSLNAQLVAEKKDFERIKQSNVNFYNKISRQLTLWERIKGRIDLKN